MITLIVCVCVCVLRSRETAAMASEPPDVMANQEAAEESSGITVITIHKPHWQPQDQFNT